MHAPPGVAPLIIVSSLHAPPGVAPLPILQSCVSLLNSVISNNFKKVPGARPLSGGVLPVVKIVCD